MRSCVVLGSGRSGTSLLAGVLHDQGYVLGGGRQIPPNPSNPKGYFEDQETHDINEALLDQLPDLPVRWGQRWLLALDDLPDLPCRPRLEERMRLQASHRPFCFKDPRFCYTLPAWRPALGDHATLCVFREPARTANSILADCARHAYLADVGMDFERAVGVWVRMYRSVLRQADAADAGDWLFVHYDRVADGAAFASLGAILGTTIRSDFADPALKRSPDTGDPGPAAAALYAELCDRAGPLS